MIKIQDLSKHFIIHILNEKRIEGFQNVNFAVEEGKSLGISGPSGAGKSSILKCIYRTYLTSSGVIHYESSLFGNMDLVQTPESKMIKIREHEMGYITQFFRVIPRVTCLDIVAEPLYADGVSHQDAKEKAREMLERLGIQKGLHDAYPGTFSGGEQQRVNIAKAVIRRPRLLLLDEPTASLDNRSIDNVLKIFGELKKLGTTMIGIFHDPEVLRKFSDTIYHVGAAG